MDRARDIIVDCLQELLAPAGILARNDASVRKLEGLPLEVITLAGEIPESVHIRMNGLQLAADLLHGQKTGVYLDQRENYLATGRWARGRVLDCFTSSGGFAAAARRIGKLWIFGRRRRGRRERKSIGIDALPPSRCFRFLSGWSAGIRWWCWTLRRSPTATCGGGRGARYKDILRALRLWIKAIGDVPARIT
jgi:hypothetical protein